MKTLKLFITFITMLSYTVSNAQLKNAKLESFKIFGNCNMCEATIEKAGNVKKVAKVDWNQDTKMAIITYDSMKTSMDVILKRIALVGYDNERYLSPDDTYAKLSGCCQYERKLKHAVGTHPKTETTATESHNELNNHSEKPILEKVKTEHNHDLEKPNGEKVVKESHAEHDNLSEKPKIEKVKTKQGSDSVKPKTKKVIKKSHTRQDNHLGKPKTTEQASNTQFKKAFEAYFAVKDALVKTDPKTASMKAQELTKLLALIEMDKLSAEEHTIWMSKMKALNMNADIISKTQDIEQQRNSFMELSKNVYALMKVIKSEAPVYYQFCPMANNGKGANWLSREHAVKNPYYGSQMLNCGKTVETIK